MVSIFEDYKLPQSFIDSILLLQSILIVPPIVDDSYYKKGTKFQKPIENIWLKDHVTIVKIAKVNQKKGTEKDIDEIRMALNMISSRNYESQKDIVIEHVKMNNNDESLKVAEFIFDIASSNKFYVELYVTLYSELILVSSIFKDVLNERVSIFVNTIDDIKEVDPSVDYDKYCRYVNENDKRRALLTFYMHLSKNKIIDSDAIFNIIQNFLSVFFEFLEKEDKTAECDEIAEIMSIFIRIGKSIDFFVSDKMWRKITEKVVIISKFKAKLYKSLSSRTAFKFLDMVDSILTI